MLKIHALDVVVTENIDANMTHTVSLTLDMHSPKPGDPPGVAHVTHVSEVGMPKRPVRKSETRKEEV
jgi:hypothetical protein